MNPRLASFVLLLVLATGSPAQETAESQIAQARANEQRVRDTLRTTTQQLRAAEAEKATLLAAQTEKDQRLAELEAQLGKLSAEAAREKAEAARAAAKLTAENQRTEAEVTRLQTTLAKWKSAHAEAVAALRKSESSRSRLQASSIDLERKVADRERQNLSLYATATEILQRYADFSLGRAIAAREPFTGLARVRLEEQIQEYGHRLKDSKLKPEPSDGKPSSNRKTAPAPSAR